MPTTRKRQLVKKAGGPSNKNKMLQPSVSIKGYAQALKGYLVVHLVYLPLTVYFA